MTKLYLTVPVAALLSGCGAGGGSAADGSLPVSSSTAPGLSIAPTPSASALTHNTSVFTQGGTGQESVVNFSGAANLTLTGSLDRIWLSAALAGGSVSVSGALNTLVFMRDVHTTIVVTGKANTFYFPLGSSLKLEGTGAASSTVRYFIP